MDRAEIERRFAYHPPRTPERAKAHELVRERCKALALSLAGNLPPGREASLAITKIEEAMYWANAAVAREPYTEQEQEGTA